MKSASLISRSAAALSLFLATGALGHTADGEQLGLAQPPIPIAFEGGHALRVAAVRERLLSQTLTYVLTVDAQGKVVDCELTYDFRRRATEHAMCRPFERHMSFEPAMDETGKATAGTYSFSVDFNMFMTQDGNLEQRFNRGLARRDQD